MPEILKAFKVVVNFVKKLKQLNNLDRFFNSDEGREVYKLNKSRTL